MTTAKFAIGERVQLMPDRLNGHVREGIYKIMVVMPLAGSGRQYRAKHELDSHERVLNEDQLRKT